MKEKPFRIGICMAGAVSAGAYTAGVIDYLLEALSEWEKQKESGAKDVPQHKVVIPIMGGASAGGMTAMLTATVLNNELEPVHLGPENQRPQTINNKLYESWVNLVADDMFPKLLNNSDIKPGQVLSMLNSDFIDEVAEKMICCKPNPWLPTPAYIETPLKLFTTLSNLKGFDYNTSFNTGSNKQLYTMSVHNDYGCFELFDNSMAAVPRTKGWIPLNFQANANIGIAKEAAMATGAFPIGLKARLLKRNASDINDIPFLDSIFSNTPIPNGIVTTLNIDGGMINNEPFDKVREVLDDISKIKNAKVKRAADTKKALDELNCLYANFENTVIMIDPFPSVEPGKFDFSQSIPNIIGKTLSAMLSQMRAKPVTYKAAMAPQDASQYIITPSRKIPDRQGKLQQVYGEKAIACGNLAGFGGFMHKDFREHDYYLGRFNCEIFLRDYFTIPEDDLLLNPIFADGYKGVDLTRFRSGNDKKEIQIIPIFAEKRKGDNKFPIPTFTSGTNWPMVKEEDIDRFRHPIRNRVQKVILNIAHWNCIIKILLLIGCQAVLNRLIGNKVLTILKDSLFDWGLISDYVPESKASKIVRFKKSKYWKTWLASLIATLLIMGGFYLVYFNVPGLVQAELAHTTGQLYDALQPTLTTNPEIIRRSLYLDFAFIAAYSMLFYFSGKLMNIIGWLTGKRVLLICLLPGILDVIENIMFLQMLGNYSPAYVYPYFNLFHWIVAAKWFLAGCGVLLVLIVAGKKFFAREE
jgi:predicted acylesterase/phospholipase RssA